MKTQLTVDQLWQEAAAFALEISSSAESSLYGVTDGKAIGTHVEHRFRAFLQDRYVYDLGNVARGIDFPSLNVDIKVTSIRQPQSSCPFRSARQKIYGLGYALLVFVYDKADDPSSQTGRLQILHTIFVDEARTADFQTTTGILRLLENSANADDLTAFLLERFLPVDEVGATQLAEEILANPPEVGYLTISNALQWRLQYQRVIQEAGNVAGITRIV
ncbi:MAG: hypothetical protein KF893_06140 [Caldilineaceae bacterium]|nr:hypothetical protein [Caldilineaceae bacterium]